jgi:predicted ATP-binding protein involved in virulence
MAISTINKIYIENFFSITNLEIDNLQDKKEIYIVGENGDGKTLLLQAIAVGLKGTLEDGLKDFRARESEFTIDIEDKDNIQNNLFAYGSSRSNYCQLKEDIAGYLTLFSGEYDLKSPTKWLQYLDYSEQKTNNNIITVTEAKKLLNYLLNSDIEIDINPNRVTFTEKGAEVSFEQLSAGYKGVITIICDLISRLSEKQQVESIADFQGVVLIDEIELHLHPRWQYGFMQKLKDTFPLIQFIVTTYSPTILLGAGMEAVYYQIFKEDGIVKISEQREVKNNFLNDIQSSIFGFDINEERINNPTKDNIARQKRAKEGLLSLIETIEKEQ